MRIDKPRGGQLRLLKEEDLAGTLVGWKPSATAFGSLVQPKGFACIRVVVQKIIDGEVKDLYDQPMLVENPGAIVVCELNGKVGLVESFRMVGQRILEAGRDYIMRLESEGRWDELVASLGEWKWELPRGLSQLSDTTDLERFVIESAKAEAMEEAGYRMTNARIVGKVNVNPTFFMHPQFVVRGKIEHIGESAPEDLEILGRTRLFSAAEIRDLVDAGILDDGLTLAALAAAGFHF